MVRSIDAPGTAADGGAARLRRLQSSPAVRACAGAASSSASIRAMPAEHGVRASSSRRGRSPPGAPRPPPSRRRSAQSRVATSARSCCMPARRLDGDAAAEQVGQQVGPGRRAAARGRRRVVGSRAIAAGPARRAVGERRRRLRAAVIQRPRPASARRGLRLPRRHRRFDLHRRHRAHVEDVRPVEVDVRDTAPRASASRASSRAGRPMRSPGAVRYQYSIRGASPGAATWSRNVFSKPRQSAVRRRYGTRRLAYRRFRPLGRRRRPALRRGLRRRLAGRLRNRLGGPAAPSWPSWPSATPAWTPASRRGGRSRLRRPAEPAWRRGRFATALAAPA